jgi:hypothetical protein
VTVSLNRSRGFSTREAQGDDLVQQRRKGTCLFVCVLEQTVSHSLDTLELSRFALFRGPILSGSGTVALKEEV